MLCEVLLKYRWSYCRVFAILINLVIVTLEHCVSSACVSCRNAKITACTQKRNMHNADSRYCGGIGTIYFSFVMLCFTLILWDYFVAMVTSYTNQSESTVLWWMYVSAMNITIYSDYDWSQCRQHSFTPDHKSVSVQTLSCLFK